MNSLKIDKINSTKKGRDRGIVLNLSLGSELVPNRPAKIPFDHVILEFWKTDKVFTFAADYMLGIYTYVYTHIIKIVLK